MEEKRIKKQRRREFLGGNPVTGGETWRIKYQHRST
uniref:Uncharacterized protein n=1 Tax=Oryza barthii TaxID=65489 RepID=A0A0D3FNV4_9ORYZ